MSMWPKQVASLWKNSWRDGELSGRLEKFLGRDGALRRPRSEGTQCEA
ncbi:MAG: hypothetical protein QOD03_1247 [Verrucomicrobiota bacterium]